MSHPSCPAVEGSGAGFQHIDPLGQRYDGTGTVGELQGVQQPHQMALHRRQVFTDVGNHQNILLQPALQILGKAAVEMCQPLFDGLRVTLQGLAYLLLTFADRKDECASD